MLAAILLTLPGLLIAISQYRKPYDGATEIIYEGIVNNASAYNKFYPPYDYGEKVTVYVAAVLVVLVAITWNDSRLAFNSSRLNRSSIVLPPSSVWTPIIQPYNCLDLKDQMEQRMETEVELRSNGWLSLLWYSRLDTVCQLDVGAFPFDEQWCNLGFSSGYASMDQLEVIAVNTTNFKMGIPEWQMLDIQAFMGNFTQYGRQYSVAEICVHLKRNPEFYIWLVILPTFVVSATCISAMLLPFEIELGDRINLGIAGMISLTFMLSVIVGELPRTPGLPLMGKWVLVEMFFCAFGMIIPMIMGLLEKTFFRESKECHRRRRIISAIIFLFFTTANIVFSVLFFAIPPVQEPQIEFLSY